MAVRRRRAPQPSICIDNSMLKPSLKNVNSSFMLGVLAVLAVNVELFTTRVAVKWDAFDEMWTYFRWLGSSLRQGYFPDYFPHIMSGYSLGANIQAGTYNIFYLAFAYAFPDSVLSINLVYLASQLVIFGLGYAIARSYRLDPPASLYLGLALTASGFVIGHASHFSYIATACGLLGCFLGIRMAVLDRRVPAFVVIFLSVYHMLTAGYPTNILFGALCLGTYWIYLLIAVGPARRSLLVAAAAAAAGGIVGIPAIWHFAHLIQLSPRGAGLDVATAMSGSLPPYGLLSFLVPVWKMGFSELTIERFHLVFMSFPLLACAVWAACTKAMDRKRILILLALAILMTVLALGKYSPLPIRVWLAEHLFFFRSGRFPSGEHRGIALFLLALISAFGFQLVQQRWPRKKILISILLLDFLIVMIGLRGMRFGGIDESYRGTVAQYKAGFNAGEQPLLDNPRDCTPDGPSWQSTAIEAQRNRLAPANFYWNGYVGLRDKAYDDERDNAREIICGPARLRYARDHAPRPYELVIYTPGYVKLKIGNEAEQTSDQHIWAEHNDGLWRLKINGISSSFSKGPANLRSFNAKGGDIVEMTYAGPLSRLWR